jgi:peptide/nickel transport system substrate-binding protein
MAVIPQEAVEENGDLSRVMVGTGPFMFVENIPNTRTVLEKNPNYWQEGRPYLDGLEYIPLPEDRARTDNIVTGNVDFADQIPQKDIDILAGNENLRLEGGLGTLYDFLFFNQRQPPFDNVKVRQAIAHALDRQAMTDVVLFGHGRPVTCSHIPPWNWAFVECDLYASPDLDKARQLLGEAGYADGFSMVIKTGAPYKAQSDAAQMVKEAVEPLGIQVEVVPTEWGTYIDDLLNKHDFEAGVVGWIGEIDPDEWLYAHFHTGEQWNFYAYSNPRVDELLEQGRTTADPDERKAIYDEVQMIIAEEAPIIPFFLYEQYEAVAAYVKGYQHMANASKITFVDTWLDK